MDALLAEEKPRLPVERVTNLANLQAVQCPLCRGVVWQPVICKSCETPFCSQCIEKWHSIKGAESCVGECNKYEKKTNVNAIMNIVKAFDTSCRYRLIGCTANIPYLDLDQHESNCDFQSAHCIGCQEEVIKGELDEHQSQCPKVVVKCDQCLTQFKQGDKEAHTPIVCLQVRFDEQVQTTKRLEQALRGNHALWASFLLTINEIKYDVCQQKTEVTIEEAAVEVVPHTE